MRYNQILLLVSCVSSINTMLIFAGFLLLGPYYIPVSVTVIVIPLAYVCKCKSQKIKIYTVLDSFGLSFLYSQELKQKKHKDLIQGYSNRKYYTMLVGFCFYLALFIKVSIASNNVDNFKIVFFIAQSINLSCQYILVNFGKYQIEIYLQVFFMQVSCYSSYVLFSLCKDFFGVLFLFYDLALIFITIIYTIFKYNEKYNHAKLILGCPFLNYKAQIYIKISCICQLIRIIILLANIQSPNGRFGLEDFSQCQSLLYFTLTFSVIQLIIWFKKVFSTKKIIFYYNQQNCFQSVNQQLQSIYFWHKTVKISFKYSSIAQEQQLLLQDDASEVLRFVDLIGKIQISKKLLIIKNYCFHPFIGHEYQILVNSSSIFEQLLQNLLQRNNAELYEVFQNRCQVFQISNIVTQQIFERIKNNISPDQQLYLNQIHSLELQLTVFDKLIRSQLYFQPTLIFYDLYEDI
ncbi:hypothetical protein ABPG74_006812 [Tetrahymena malaccensis]